MASKPGHNSSLNSDEVRNTLENMINELKSQVNNAKIDSVSGEIKEKTSNAITNGVKQGIKNAKSQKINIGEKVEIIDDEKTVRSKIRTLLERRKEILNEESQKVASGLDVYLDQQLEKTGKRIRNKLTKLEKASNKAINAVDISEQEKTLKQRNREVKNAQKKRVELILKADSSDSLANASTLNKINKLRDKSHSKTAESLDAVLDAANALVNATSEEQEQLINELREDFTRRIALLKKKGKKPSKAFIRDYEDFRLTYGDTPKALSDKVRTDQEKILQDKEAELIRPAIKDIDKELKALLMQRLNNIKNSISKEMSGADYDSLTDSFDGIAEVIKELGFSNQTFDNLINKINGKLSKVNVNDNIPASISVQDEITETTSKKKKTVLRNLDNKSLRELVELYHELGTTRGSEKQLNKLADAILNIVQAEEELNSSKMQSFTQVLRGLTFVDGDSPILKQPYSIDEAVDALKRLGNANQQLNQSGLSSDNGIERMLTESEAIEEIISRVQAKFSGISHGEITESINGLGGLYGVSEDVIEEQTNDILRSYQGAVNDLLEEYKLVYRQRNQLDEESKDLNSNNLEFLKDRVASYGEQWLQEISKIESAEDELFNNGRRLTSDHIANLQDTINQIPQKLGTTRFVHWTNKESSEKILGEDFDYSKYSDISKMTAELGKADEATTKLITDIDDLWQKQADKGSAVIIDIPDEEVEKFKEIHLIGSDDSFIPNKYIQGIIDTKEYTYQLNETIESQIENQNELQQELDETSGKLDSIANNKVPSSKNLSERINSRIRKYSGTELSAEEFEKVTDKITEIIKLMDKLGYNTDGVKARFSEFVKSVTIAADQTSEALHEEAVAQEKVDEQFRESVQAETNASETVAQVEKAATAIKEEGQEAEVSAKKKEKFAEANKKVAKSSEETAESTKKATKSIKEEGSEAEKNRAEFERLISSGKLLNTKHTYEVDSQGKYYSHERSFSMETTSGRTLKETLVPEKDDDGNFTGEFTVAYEQATNYTKIVKDAVKATLDLQKAKHNLLLEDQKQNPNLDNINSFVIQVNDAQRRLDEATNSAEQFAREISHFYNDPNYGSKYIMPMFYGNVNDEVAYKQLSEDVRYNNASDSMATKQRKEADSAIDSIQRLNNYLSTTQEYVNNIQATYDKSIDPNLKRAVTDTQDLADLDNLRLNILQEISRLENSDPATANLQPLKNMMAQYQREVRIRQNKGRTQIKDSDLPTYIQKEDNVLTDLISHSKIYGGVSQQVTSELEQQLQILRAGALTSDEFYDVQDVRKYYQAVLDGIKRTQNQDYTRKTTARDQGQSLFDWWNYTGSTKNLTDDIVTNANNSIKVIEDVLQKWEKINNGTAGIDIISAQELTDMEDAVKYMTILRKQYSLSDNKLANQNSIFKYLSQVNKLLSDNTKRSFKNTGVYRDLVDLQERLKHFDTSNAQVEVDKLSTELLELKSRFEGLSDEVKGKGFFQELASAAGTQTRQFIAQWFSFQDIIRYGRSAFETIRELDTALVDLRKTTTMTNDELNSFYYEANDVAKQLGVTTAEVIQQSASWSRLGFSTKEAATGLAQLSSQFASISPGMDTETAQSGLVSIMKAWDIDVNDVQRSIMDNINILGNSFAETNEDIVNGMQRAAAALSAVGTTYQDAFALFTGGK